MGEIPPHAKARVRVLLNRWFRLSEAGRYSVVLIDCRNSREGEDPGGSALTTEVVFEVLPFDEKRLAAVCDQLAQAALSSRDDEAKEAAITLSWIDSPVAAPYLKKVLDANVFESFFVVAGLAHINTPETVSMLIDAFDRTSGFTRMKIKDCLYQMKPQIADPTLRHKLDLILAWQPKIVE